jgi:GGDEF domain-containing protein
VLIFEIDDYMSINDQCGHRVGVVGLMLVAARLRA